MGYTVSIGMVINQPFENGDVTPHHTAIHGDYCHTIISCVGKAPADLEYDEPNGEMSYHFWQNLLMMSKGLRMLATHIEKSKMQIIYLGKPEVKEIIAQIKTDLPKIDKPKSQSEYRERAKWLVFWAEESMKRYDQNAAIGLF